MHHTCNIKADSHSQVHADIEVFCLVTNVTLEMLKSVDSML